MSASCCVSASISDCFSLLKPSRKIAGIDVESMPGGEEIRQLLDDAQADLADIDKAVKEIKTSSVRQDAQALYATGARILTYLEEKSRQN